MKNLTITCDDCGLSEGINLATVMLYRRKIVASASVMANFQATQHAIALFSRYPSLNVGVHLNLTDGFSLTEMGSSALTHPDGRFRSRINLFTHSLFPGTTFIELVEKELTAQINVFIRAGLQPRHLTTHIHFHAFPTLRKIVFKIARSFHVQWVRTNSLRAAVVPFNPIPKRQGASTEFSEAGSIAVPDYVVGLKYWMKYNPKQLLVRLLNLNGTIELVVHPCLPEDESYPSNVHYSPHERFKEMQYLERFYEVMQH